MATNHASHKMPKPLGNCDFDVIELGRKVAKVFTSEISVKYCLVSLFAFIV